MWFKKTHTQKEVNQTAIASQIKTLDSLLTAFTTNEDADRKVIILVLDQLIEDLTLKLQAVDADKDWRSVGIKL